VIQAPRKTPNAIYIKKARYEGQSLERLFLSHQKLVEGGTLQLDLTAKPKKKQ
jgi:putative alpha-1,2-mannosidase